MATISSHTLDATDGTHASGVEVILVNTNTGVTLLKSSTDQAGRLNEAVIFSEHKPDDRFELIFCAGKYWAGKGINHAQLVDEIVLRFRMPNANARYHMPLIFSPNGYSTWASAAEE